MGIALHGLLCKLIDHCIILDQLRTLNTYALQFVYKTHTPTLQCVSMIQETIILYLQFWLWGWFICWYILMVCLCQFYEQYVTCTGTFNINLLRELYSIRDMTVLAFWPVLNYPFWLNIYAPYNFFYA